MLVRHWLRGRRGHVRRLEGCTTVEIDSPEGRKKERAGSRESGHAPPRSLRKTLKEPHACARRAVRAQLLTVFRERGCSLPVKLSTPVAPTPRDVAHVGDYDFKRIRACCWRTLRAHTVAPRRHVFGCLSDSISSGGHESSFPRRPPSNPSSSSPSCSSPSSSLLSSLLPPLSSRSQAPRAPGPTPRPSGGARCGGLRRGAGGDAVQIKCSSAGSALSSAAAGVAQPASVICVPRAST